jgi:hypothetical protein
MGIFVSRAATGNCPEIAAPPKQKEESGGSHFGLPLLV